MISAVRSWKSQYRERKAVLTDVLLWVVLALPVLLGSPIGPVHLTSWWRPLALLPLAVAIGLARAFPVVSLCLGAALSLTDAWFFCALFALSYLAGRRSSRERRTLFVFGGILVLGTGALLAMPGTGTGLSEAPLLAASMMPWLVGRYRRLQQELVTAGWERAAHLEREQHDIADRARLMERWRIAQDIHDQLGHDLSLLALRIGALEVASDLDERVRTAASEVREGTTQAVERLHDVIGVLRAEAEPNELGPVREDIAEIVGRARRFGMAVRLERAGEQAELPPLVEQATRLVVQEALTNAMKHAPGAAVTVRLEREAGETVVSVRNAPVPAGPLPGARGSGLGMAGLSDRVRMLGGTLDARPHEGGFEVIARLPDSGRVPGSETRGTLPAGAFGEGRERARKTVRRSLITAVVAPLAMVTVLLSVMMAYFADATDVSVLRAGDFAGMTVGQDQESLRATLPAQQVPVGEVGGNAPPPGARCEYYRTRNGDLFESDIQVYRLCFANESLVSKDEVPAKLG